MMPQLVTVRVDRAAGRPIRIWVPILPILLILSPVLILAVLVGAVACLVYRISVFRAAATSWRIFAALSGTRIDVMQEDTGVAVAIR